MMAFAAGDKDTAENNKQHINLSMQAYEVVMSDMFTFGEEKLSGFINTIFAHYSPVAKASVSRSLNTLRGELDKWLSGIPGDERTKTRIINGLVIQRRNRLIEQASSYGSGKAFKFWLNKENLTYLTEENSECGEEAYYGKRGKYIKSVIEEYTRLPYVQRELIYFQPSVEKIRCAIRDERQLRVVTGADSVYGVYPCDILCDPLSTANYLVGYCKRYALADEEKQPCSFRLSALKSVKVERSKSAFLKAGERKELAQKIASRGVQFMAGSETEIHVKLTEAGLYKYRRQTHLRPVLVRKENECFVFQCTVAQAEFYFFKFGKDAEIILPVSLREKFRLMYEEAAGVYRMRE
jgi:hypothetical protein